MAEALAVRGSLTTIREEISATVSITDNPPQFMKFTLTEEVQVNGTEDEVLQSRRKLYKKLETELMSRVEKLRKELVIGDEDDVRQSRRVKRGVR